MHRSAIRNDGPRGIQRSIRDWTVFPLEFEPLWVFREEAAAPSPLARVPLARFPRSRGRSAFQPTREGEQPPTDASTDPKNSKAGGWLEKRFPSRRG